MKTILLTTISALLLSSCSKLADAWHTRSTPFGNIDTRKKGGPIPNANLVYRNKSGAIEMIAQTDAKGKITVHNFTNNYSYGFMSMSVNGHLVKNKGTHYEIDMSDGSRKIMTISEGNKFIKQQGKR